MLYFEEDLKSLPVETLSVCLASEYAHIHSSPEGLRLTRDPLGAIPLYYCVKAGRIYVSTMISKLNNHFHTVNEKFVKQLEKKDFSLLSQTIYKNIFRVPPGHHVNISSTGQIDIEAYFKPQDFFQHWGAQRDLQNTPFQDLLDKSIAKRNKDKLSTVFLSGGIDSSTITRLMPEPSTALHLKFHKIPELDPFTTEYVRKSFPQNIKILDTNSFDSKIWHYNYKTDPQSIFYDPTLWLYKPLLSAAKQLDFKRVFSGLGGDDLCQPDLTYLSKRPLLKGIAEFFKATRHYREEINLTTEFYRCLIHPHFTGEANAKKSVLNRFFLSGQYTFAMEQEQELAQHYGLWMSYPLLDLEIMAYVWNASSEQLAGRFSNKNLIRTVAARYFPEEFCAHISEQDYSNFRKQNLLEQGIAKDPKPKMPKINMDDELIRFYTLRSREQCLPRSSHEQQETLSKKALPQKKVHQAPSHTNWVHTGDFSN